MRPSSSFALSLGVVGALGGACISSLTNPDSAYSVTVSARVGARGAYGDTITFTIANVGDRPAYIDRCGAGPTILIQQFVGSEWRGGVQNFMCPVPATPGPIVLDPSATMTVVRVLEAGEYRVRIRVASKSDMGDLLFSQSNAFRVE